MTVDQEDGTVEITPPQGISLGIGNGKCKRYRW